MKFWLYFYIQIFGTWTASLKSPVWIVGRESHLGSLGATMAGRSRSKEGAFVLEVDCSALPRFIWFYMSLYVFMTFYDVVFFPVLFSSFFNHQGILMSSWAWSVGQGDEDRLAEELEKLRNFIEALWNRRWKADFLKPGIDPWVLKYFLTVQFGDVVILKEMVLEVSYSRNNPSACGIMFPIEVVGVPMVCTILQPVVHRHGGKQGYQPILLKDVLFPNHMGGLLDGFLSKVELFPFTSCQGEFVKQSLHFDEIVEALRPQARTTVFCLEKSLLERLLTRKKHGESQQCSFWTQVTPTDHSFRSLWTLNLMDLFVVIWFRPWIPWKL